MKLLPRIIFCIVAMMSVAPHGVCQTGSISGTVTVAGTGEPVKEGQVFISQLTGDIQVSTYATIVNGTYVSDPTLPDGSYMVKISSAFNGSTPYLIQVYDTGACSNNCDEKATPVVVENGSAITGINFQLQPGGAIHGKVASILSMANDATVQAFNVTTGDQYSSFAFHKFDYTYDIDGVVPGIYYVFAHNFTEGFSPMLYGDVSCSMLNKFRNPPCLFAAATPIQVETYSNIENVNITLTHGGKVGGVVRDSKTKKPIADVSVIITDAGNAKAKQSITALTDSEGRYSFTNVFPEGEYFIKVQAGSKYQYEIYDNIYCKDASCDATKGTPINLAAGQTFSANFDLSLASTQSPGKPDLKGTISTSKRGKNVKITVQVQNSGTASSEPCDVVLFFSKKTSLSSKEVAVATFSLSTLKAKGKKTLTTTVPIQKGKSYVIASIDYNKVVSERNERNNLVNQRIR